MQVRSNAMRVASHWRREEKHLWLSQSSIETATASSLWRFRKVPGARVNKLNALENVDGDAFYYYACRDACAVPAKHQSVTLLQLL